MPGPHPQLDAYLNSPAGRDTAQAMAEAIFNDEVRLVAYELADESHSTAVEAALDRLIARRNAKDNY